MRSKLSPVTIPSVTVLLFALACLPTARATQLPPDRSSSTPAPSPSVTRRPSPARRRAASAARRADQRQSDEKDALTGDYKGEVRTPESEASVEARLHIDGDQFKLVVLSPGSRPQTYRGRLKATLRDDRVVDCVFTFDEGRITEQRISARATLTDDGWKLENAESRQYSFAFVQTTCPKHPYCLPIRNCRPCKP